MNCTMYYQLQQRAYLADVRHERAEADRLRREISAHLETCATCSGLLTQTLTLEQSLFGREVKIGKEINHEGK